MTISMFQSDICFTNDRLSPALSSMVAGLTHLDWRDVSKLKFSQLRLLKMHCPNLEVFSLAVTMTVKHVMMSVSQIQVTIAKSIQFSLVVPFYSGQTPDLIGRLHSFVLTRHHLSRLLTVDYLVVNQSYLVTYLVSKWWVSGLNQSLSAWAK
jgi:hypothetical protein